MSTPPKIPQSSFFEFPAFPSRAPSPEPERETRARPSNPAAGRSAQQLQRDRPPPTLSRYLMSAGTAAPSASAPAVAAGIITASPPRAVECLDSISQSSEHLSVALRRCEPLLSGKPAAEAAQARANAMRNVEHYLHNNDCGTIPPRLKNLFALCDETIEDVQAVALPHGRHNMFVDNRDAVAGRAWLRPRAYNRKEMTAREYLSEATREIYAAMQPAPTAGQRVQQVAAAAMFTGSTSCTGYAAAFAALLAQRCAELELSEHENVRIELVEMPELNGKPVDHMYCRVTYSAPGEDGRMTHHELICDPWSKMSTPILPRHSRFENGTPIESIDVKSARLSGAGLRDGLVEADRIYAEREHSDRLRISLATRRYLVAQAPRDGSFTVENSYHGLVQPDRLDFVKPGTTLPRKRRPTRVPATESNLIQAKSLSLKTRNPRAVANLLLEHVDAAAWFKQWTDALALPAGAATLRAALTHRFEDGVSMLGKAIEFGCIDLLQAIDTVLQRHDLGGIAAADWHDALLAADGSGEPALVRMLHTLHSPGNLVEGMPAAIVRSYGKLVQRLPEAERDGLMKTLFGALGSGHTLPGALENPTYEALLELLPQDANEMLRDQLESGRHRAARGSDEE